MFIFKRIVLILLSPLTLALVLIATGLVLSLWKRHLSKSRVAILAGLVLLVVAGYGWGARGYLASRERVHPALDLSGGRTPALASVRHVAVLGAGHISSPDLPVTAWPGASGLFRIVEGIRVHRRLPGTKLIFSGGPGLDRHPTAKVAADIAAEMGVPRSEMILLPGPEDTRQEAQAMRPIVGTQPFVLVTSAGHMPRAMETFRAQGMNPIPATTDYLFPAGTKRQALDIFPSIQGLACATRATYEVLATMQERFRNWRHEPEAPATPKASPTAPAPRAAGSPAPG